MTWAAQRAGDPVGSDVDVTVETVVHLGQALTLRENPYCCFVVIVNTKNIVLALTLSSSRQDGRKWQVQVGRRYSGRERMGGS